jgi:bla regulator protein BlaR1
MRWLRECARSMRVEPIGVAMPGVRLPERVRRIVDGGGVVRISRVRFAGVMVACVAICGTFAAGALVRAQTPGEDWEKAAGGKMAFDVASVKANVGSDTSSDSNVPFFGERYPANGGLFSARNNVLSMYLAFAYKLSRTQFRLLDSEMPKWAAGQRFDIQARAPAGTTKDQMRLMMQSLLAERFQLKAHLEMRDTQVFALELVKPGVTGLKLRPHTDDPPCAGASTTISSGPLGTTPLGFPLICGSPIGSVTPSGASYSGRNISLQAIAESFNIAPNNPRIDRPVIDRTGLAGNYDFVVNYWPQSNSTSPPPDDAAPVLFEALKQDLGLKLEATTAPFKTLVIDHVEEPTAN